MLLIWLDSLSQGLRFAFCFSVMVLCSHTVPDCQLLLRAVWTRCSIASVLKSSVCVCLWHPLA